jgi:hypothetical protein
MADRKSDCIVVGDRLVINRIPDGGLHIHLPNRSADISLMSRPVRNDLEYFDALEALREVSRQAIDDGVFAGLRLRVQKILNDAEADEAAR